MPFDVAEALKAGYSQQEIATFLGEQKKFDTQKAFESGYSPDEVISFLNPKEQTTGERLKRAAVKGFEAIPESAAGIGLGVSSALGLESTGRQAEAIRKEAKKEAELPQGITWDELEKTYGTEGAFAALKKFPTYVAEQILQSAPSMAIPLAAGAAGAALSGPLAPIVGPLAGIAAYGGQQFGQFMQRQAQEGATPETLAPGKAALAAAATAPIGYFADRFTLGMSKVPTKVLGEEISKELAKRTSGVAGRAAAGASLGIIAEAPTEVLEQAAERWQAGLDLTGEEAKKEYKEAFFGAAAVGGVGGAAARVLRGAPAEPEVAPPPAIPPSPVAEPSLTGTAPAEMIEALSRPQNADMMAAIRGREEQQAAQAEAQRVEEERAAAETKRLEDEAQRAETARQISERERVRAMPGFTGADTTNAGILQAQREKEEAEAVALEKGKEVEYRKILGTTFSADPLQNFRQQQAAIERLDYTTPEMKKQIPAIYDQLKVLSEEPDTVTTVTPPVTTVTPPVTAVAPIVEPPITPAVAAPVATPAPIVAPPVAAPIPAPAPIAAPAVAAPIAAPPAVAPALAIEESKVEPIKQDKSLASQPTYTESTVLEVPVPELTLSKDVPQFKSDANQNGVVQATKLEGKFDRRLASPVQVWQRNNGQLEVISGRHRLDLAQRSGEKTIPAQIYKESEGFNADMARMLDIELNVKDGRGKVKDYVSFFKEFGLPKEQARAEGLLNTAIGRQAYEIADAGSPSLIAAHFNKDITDDAATAIAINAPRDEALQNLGMQQVRDGKSINHAVNFMRSAMAAGFKGKEGSGDLFGFDDSFAKEAEAVTKEATKQQREARQQLSAIRGAAKSPEKARLGGVDVKNLEQTQAKIAELEKTINELENFHTNPELYKKLRQAAGLEEGLVSPTPESLKAQEERAKSEEKRIAAEKKEAEDKAKADAEVGEFKLAGSDRAADQDSDQDQMFSVETGEDKNSADLFDYIKDFDSALDAINKYASNDAQKEIANLITTRINQLKKLGFKFSLGVTKDGYSLNNGARGVSVITYSGLGESTSIKITLNHPSNGDQSGTRWKTVAHEIAHAATQAQIKFAPKGSAAEKLNNLFNDVIKYFNNRVKQKNLTVFEKKIYDRQYNALRDPDELLAWGLTNEEMQKWLSGIKSKNGSFLSRLFDVVANALGISENNTALSELLSISENLLTEVTDSYIEAASKRGKSFGLQQNKTKYPSWALSLADGRDIAWNEKDAALVETKSINGNKLYLLATPSGITRVGVDSYAGDMLSPARLKEVQNKAKELEKVVVKFDDKGQGQMFSLRGKPESQVTAFQETLRNLLNKFGLKDVGVNLIEGMRDEGSYASKLIQIAADSANPIRTLRHEAVHALRELGFFTDAQWKSLSKMAKDKWIDQYLKQRNVDGKSLKAGEESRYDAYMREYKGDMEKITEEAVADAFADFESTKPPAGMLQSLLKRLSNLFQSIKSALTKIEAPEQIFAKVEKGALKPEAERAPSESKSLRDRATANFKRWFGDSKVVDENGEPLVVYHGTNTDFAEFKAGDGMLGKGIYFTPNAKSAQLYPMLQNMRTQREGREAGAISVMPVYVSLRNPLVLTDLPASKVDATRVASQGYDGIVLLNPDGTTKELTAFRPEQIKSAIGNNGEYSLTDADIRKSLRTSVESLKESAQKFLQKRQPLDREALSDIKDEDFKDALGGVFNPQNKTVIDKVEGMKDGFWRRVAQGVADQYRTIKDYDPVSYMLARLSKTVDGALEGLMLHGHVFNDGGALNIRQNTKGMLEALKPLGKEVDRYQMWIAINRESKLPADKRSPKISALIPNKDLLVQGTLNGKPRLEVYQSVQKDMNALNKSVLDVALNAGIINSSAKDIEAIRNRTDLTEKQKQDKIDKIKPGAYEIFSNDIFYIPFYKEMEDGDVQSSASAAGLDRQKFSAELKGMTDKPFGDLMENTLRNWSHILSASMKNQAANSTINATMKAGATIPNMKVGLAYRDGVVYSTKNDEVVGDGVLRPEQTRSEGKGMVKIMRDGYPMYFEVLDPMLLESIISIGYMGPKSKFLEVARDFKNVLQFGVTISPTFKVNNLIRDSISAMAVSDLEKNPFGNVAEGWAASRKNNPAYISAMAGGAVFNYGSTYEGDQAKLVKQLIKQGVRPDSILDSPDKIKAGLKLLWNKYQEFGNRSEAANRIALYNQLRADKKDSKGNTVQGMSHMEASFHSRDLLDFSMQGSWQAFRTVTMVVPFLNARVQGLYKLGRDGITPTTRVLYNTVTGKEITASDRQKAYSFSVTTSAVALASMALYMAFKDDEDFQKRDEWDRDNFWWIKIPGMDYALRVPKPFEVGAFGTLAERTLEQIVDQGSEGKQFGSSIGRMLFDTFALNPTPQMFKPLIDLYANKDSFTGAPIESAGMERLSKQERATDTTSPIAKLVGGMSSFLGEKGELSPVQVDYAIKSYFGWLGATAATTSMYATMPFREGAYPDTVWMDKASLGLIKTLPSNQSRYTTAFYESNKDISQAFADMRHFAEAGESEKVERILEEKGDKIALAKFYDKTAKSMANIRKQIRMITNDESMSGADKREEIDRMKEIISMLSKQAEDTRKAMK